MTVLTREHRSRTRRREQRALRLSSEPLVLRAPEPLPHARERAAGGPEDTAHYDCPCGCVFEAPVSTSVGCPHCGGAQAW